MRTIDLSRLRPGPDVWELGLVWHPVWQIEKNQPAFRPMHAWCMSRTGRAQISFGPSRPGEDGERMCLLVLTKMIRAGRARLDMPSRILVRNEATRKALASHTTGSGVLIEVVDDLPLVDQGEARLRATTFDPFPEGYLSGVDRNVLHEYAHAACEFAIAMPWLTLHDSDLVEIEPAAEGMRYCVLSGGTGVSRGLHFSESPEEHRRFAFSREEIGNHPRWIFTIDTGLHIPNADLDLWDDLGLPWIGGRELPLLEKLGGDALPTDEDVTYVTALLRALADIGLRGIDGTRMHKIVKVLGGPMSLTLSVRELVGARL
jgi:hypothetical protein